MTIEALRKTQEMGRPEYEPRYFSLLFKLNPGLVETVKPTVLQQVVQNDGEEEKMLAIVRHSISYVSGLGKKAYADY